MKKKTTEIYLRKNEMGLGLVLFFGILLIGVIAIEVFLRIQGKHPPQTDYVYDSEVGWLPDDPHFGVESDTSSDLVLFIGDSFTNPPDGYIKSYANIHNSKCNHKIQVITLGVPGFGTGQAYLMLKKYIKKYRPKLVVLGFYVWNDLADNMNDIYYSSVCNNNRPAFAVQNNQLIQIQKPNKIKYLLSRYSAIYRAISEYMVTKNINGIKAYTNYVDQYRDFYINEKNIRCDRAWEITDQLLIAIQHVCKENNARFLLIAFNNPFSVEKEVYEHEVIRTNGDFLRLDIDKPLKMLDRSCAAKNIDFINITQKFYNYRKLHPADTIYRKELGGHFTALANDLVGDTIFKFIRSKNLITCNNSK